MIHHGELLSVPKTIKEHMTPCLPRVLTIFRVRIVVSAIRSEYVGDIFQFVIVVQQGELDVEQRHVDLEFRAAERQVSQEVGLLNQIYKHSYWNSTFL